MNMLNEVTQKKQPYPYQLTSKSATTRIRNESIQLKKSRLNTADPGQELWRVNTMDIIQ